jgi:DNA replication and repair protein RecF
MYLKQLYLTNFRNLTEQKINFSAKLNILFGKNGQGKTSILESIYFLSISKSFRTKSEKIALQFEKDFFDIKGNFKGHKHEDISVRVFYSLNDGKHIFLNENKLEKFSELIGIIPVILLSLEDLELTYGVPSNRRRFIDILLSQVSPIYLNALQKYKKSVLQRNKHLSLIFDKVESVNSIFPWDEQLARYGSDIIEYRLAFIEYMNTHVSNYYKILSENDEKIRLEYKSRITPQKSSYDKKDIEKKFKDLLKSELQNDIQRQSTAIGPHRDDIYFFINDNLLKSFGSQGENKTFLIALKLIEGNYLKDRLKVDPIFLMDDIFGELDSNRIERLTNYTTNIGQTFITTANNEKFSGTVSNDINLIRINNGHAVQ